jgi:hypothetical protein
MSIAIQYTINEQLVSIWDLQIHRAENVTE